jgi:hypothetical protein
VSSRPDRRPRSTDASTRAGDGNRTHVACLEGRYSTIELHPPWARPRTSVEARSGEVGSRWLGVGRGRAIGVALFVAPSESGSWGRSSSPRSIRRDARRWVEQDSNLRRHCHQIYSLAPLATWVSTRLRPGFIPFGHFHPHRAASMPHSGLFGRRESRAGGESRTHNRRFTKPVLCRLSYASRREAVKIPTIPFDLANARGFSRATVLVPAGGGACRIAWAAGRQRRATAPWISGRAAIEARSCVGTLGELRL